MDELAAELGMDPMELRRKNWIKHEEFPFTTVCGLTYDSGNYEAATDKALELIGWDDLRREQAERRDRKDPVQLGLGISTFTEMCGLAPSRVLGSLDYGAGGWENASIRMLATGKVEVVTGASRARAGPRDGVQPDRRRPARRAVRGRRGHPRRHAVLAQGPGHLRLALAGRRRHRDRQGGREGRSRRPGRSPRTCSRPTRTTSSSRTARSRSRAPPGSSVSIGEIAFADLHGAQPARRRRAVPGRRRDLRPGELLLPARHAPVRDRDRHRDRLRRRSASTSASTTSARRSTR